MKLAEFNNILKFIKTKINEALTPEAKMTELEAARIFVAKELPGIEGIVANSIINILEATIKIPKATPTNQPS